MKLRVLVCGARDWKDWATIYRVLAKIGFENIEVLIEGHATGADRIAHWLWAGFGNAPRCYPAKWVEYGRAAGPIRNGEMLKKEKPNLVLAFHPKLSDSKGTKNMVKQAKKKKIRVLVFSGKSKRTGRILHP